MQRIRSAFSEEFGELRIIDVTQSSFREEVPEIALLAMSQDFIDGFEQRESVSAEIREALSRSVLGRALAAASGSYLSGMGTYLIKLGPKNLWAGAHEIDRRIVGSFPALTSRIRLQDMAHLLADGLEQQICAKRGRPVCMLNIGGGTAADSWNALLCLRARVGPLLGDRSIRVAVLDRDECGPAFGARAVEALQKPGAPLHGLNIDFEFICYDWSYPHRLSLLLPGPGAEDSGCAISSEGGLFEYGSDEEIVANLTALRAGTPLDAFIVGSVTRDCEAVRANRQIVASRPRTIEAFRVLVEGGGWKLNQVIERPFSYHVSLVHDPRRRSTQRITSIEVSALTDG